ncbi:hypothetical protein [Peribacillus butanolivorans]|uniref:hypothetical protein n=1 Tax=Peribacillus butanolivorans TaxID=421767 RepID=UPI0036D83152
MFDKFLFNKRTLYLSLILVPLSLIIGIGIIKKWGINFADLGPYGDFLAGTTVPILTFISFLALVMTLNLQKEQIDNQRKEFKENRDQIYQSSLPERIINLEESIDILRETIKEIELLSREDFLDHLTKSPHERELKLFGLSENYVLKETDNFKKITISTSKKVRKHVVRVNTETYKAFIKFKNDIFSINFNQKRKIDSDFTAFYQKRMELYMDSYPLLVISGPLSEIPLTDDENRELNKLKSQLYRVDQECIQLLSNAYSELTIKLNNILEKLINDLK